MDFERMWDSISFHEKLDDFVCVLKKKGISKEDRKEAVKEFLDYCLDSKKQSPNEQYPAVFGGKVGYEGHTVVGKDGSVLPKIKREPAQTYGPDPIEVAIEILKEAKKKFSMSTPVSVRIPLVLPDHINKAVFGAGFTKASNWEVENVEGGGCTVTIRAGGR